MSSSKLSILGNNIKLCRRELRKSTNVGIKAIIRAIDKFDTKRVMIFF